MSEVVSSRLARGDDFPPGLRHACFLHGAGGGGWEWNIWLRVFRAHGWRAQAPELQAVAQGLAATCLHDYIAQARAAIEILTRPRVVVGASLGGLLAYANASLVDALVLVNPLPPAPWQQGLPEFSREGDTVPWLSTASLAGTRRALFDADEATCLYAFRRWRDESSAVLREAREGIALPLPTCPIFMIVSGKDEDVPENASLAFAEAVGARVLRLPEASHVGPLLGRGAADVATQAVDWLNGIQKTV